MAEEREKNPETLMDNDNENMAEAVLEGAASDSSSDSDADSDDAPDNLQVAALESAIAENPANYDVHVQYVQCLRKLGDIEKLRLARRSMNEIFPLSPTMWQEWAKDEISLCEGLDFSVIEEIYEKGVGEYLSVPLWCDYLTFIQEHDQLVAQCEPVGLEKMRGLFERAVTAAGLHVAEGNRIWDAYKEFEQAIYLTIDESNIEEREKQLCRIRSLFHRQLAIPLVEMKSTLISYKLWEGEHGNTIECDGDEMSGLPVSVISAFKKALEMYNDRAAYEDQLSKQDLSELDRLQIFMNYIKMEEFSDDPVRVQLIYERAISSFPVSGDLWTGYTGYLDRCLKVSNVLKNVYSRATRNCPWIGDLWIHYLLSLERVHTSEQELSSVFEKSLQSTFTNVNEYLQLFLTRIDGLRRRISSAVANDTAEYTVLRETFQRAADYLSPQLTKIEDLLLLYTYWSRLEATHGKDLVAARGVWERLIKQCGLEYDVWKGYIAMEISFGHLNNARSIYKRCYSKRLMGNGSEEVCLSWLRFEREYGSLDEFDLAVKKVTPRLEELKLFQLQQESKYVAPPAISKDVPQSKNDSKKRKMNNKIISDQSPASRHDNVQTSSDRLPRKEPNEDDTRAEMKVDESTSEATLGSEKHSQKHIKSFSSEKNMPGYRDQCTAFVSNLDFKVNEEDLRKFFNGNGGVSAIRILKDKFTGKSRGLAYLDFMDEEHLSAAILKNKQKLLGKRISVARSDPTKSKKRTSTVPGGSAPSDSKVMDEDFQSKDREPGSRGYRELGTASHKRGGHVQLTGSNMFAMPRSIVRPLGWSNKESNPQDEQQLKSNAEFKEMLLKK